MSRKLFSSITILILCCISLFAGVFAASTANHTISGNLSYELSMGISKIVDSVVFEHNNIVCTSNAPTGTVEYTIKNTTDLFNISGSNLNITLTDSVSGRLSITGSGDGTEQTIKYTGTGNYSGTLTATIVGTNLSATVSYTTQYTSYDHEAYEIYIEDDGSHYYVCEDCGEMTHGYCDSTSRYYTEWDSVDHWIYCSSCDVQLGYESHGTQGTYFDSDNTYHREVCSACDYIMEEEAHDYDIYYTGNGTHAEECSTCGWLTEDIACSYGDWYSLDDSDHTQQCEYCGDTSWMMDSHGADGVYYQPAGGWHDVHCDTCGQYLDCVECTYEFNGNGNDTLHELECTACGYTMTESCDYVYSYYNSAYCWYGCTVCTNGSRIAHDLSYEAMDSVFCEMYCANCDLNETVEHVFSYSSGGSSACIATCSNCEISVTNEHSLSYVDDGPGSHTGKCSVCSYTTSGRHNYVDGKCSLCGRYSTSSASLVSSPSTALSTPAVSTYGVVNTALNKIMDTGVLDVVEKSNQNNLMKKQYITKIKKILSLI